LTWRRYLGTPFGKYRCPVCDKRGKLATSLTGILSIIVLVSAGAFIGDMTGGGYPWGIWGILGGALVALPVDRYVDSTRTLHKYDSD
jgi:hypothetical protein